MTALQILQSKFGYNAFRLEQEAIINSVLQKKDTFALMPTGGGKSLCYQIPALMFDGLTIVISPLIALMKDQVDALRVNGIEAAFLNSTQSSAEQREILTKITFKKLKLLYLAPESGFLRKITSFNISLIAIDEAHCISHWGHDFRPEYLQLAQLKRTLPNVPIIALTATADRLTRKDIIEKLELNRPATFVSSFNRANIRYTIEPKKDSFEKLLTFLEKRKDESGVIYCLSRASTEKLASDLSEQGLKALPYHAGIEKEIRTKHQEMFLRDEVKIIVATIAFGMGIDKSNVRYVVHMDLPKSIESYYQETGRAGRDGLPSEALFFYSYADVSKMKRFVEIEGNTKQTEIQLRKLDQMAEYGSLATCRRKYLLNYFDEQATGNCGNCDTCLTKVDRVDGTELAQQVIRAVKTLKERFGTSYAIDFMRGSASEKIRDYHKTLPGFGSGASTNKQVWSDIIHDLIAQDYLSKSAGMYPVLSLTSKSEAVLNGTERVMIVKSKEKIETGSTTSYEPTGYEVELFQQLKVVRRELANAENVPAYIVLSDATLIELATYLPHTREEFSKISGFGQMKLEKYSQQFCDVIVDYCASHKLASRIQLKIPKRQVKSKSDRDTDTKQASFERFKQGHSIQQIAEQRNLNSSTIEGHLAFYVERGQLSAHEIMDVSKIPAIREVIAQTGDEMIGPIKQQLGEAYSYGEIRIAMAHLKKNRLIEA